MKAMLLAAGIGSRLGELTKNSAKCLVPVAGKAIIEYVIENLKKAQVDELIINLHHFPELIKKYVSDKKSFGLKISYSEEVELLGTGGGLANAKQHFLKEADFIVHNSDVYSDIDLNTLISHHRQNAALATLAVMSKQTSRPLFFDVNMNLAGWGSAEKNEMLCAMEQTKGYNFTGIQVCSSRIFEYMPKDKKSFSIIETYMNAARAGEKILAYKVDSNYWIDVGTPERLQQLAERIDKRMP